MKVFSYSNTYGFHQADNEWSKSVPNLPHNYFIWWSDWHKWVVEERLQLSPKRPVKKSICIKDAEATLN